MPSMCKGLGPVSYSKNTERGKGGMGEGGRRGREREGARRRGRDRVSALE